MKNLITMFFLICVVSFVAVGCVSSEKQANVGAADNSDKAAIEALLEKMEDASVDVIIMDMAMPGMDGLETQKKLLQINPDLQIIFLTGYATLEKGINAVKLGAFDFIEKPVEFDKLLKKIEQAETKKKDLDIKKAERDIKDILKKKGW